MTENFPVLLKTHLVEIARALPRHLSAERMSRIALTAFRLNPKLAQCDPRSVFAAVIQSAQLGLEVGLLGEAHLVPFGNECQLIPGYQGLMKLARNSGQVVDIYAQEVRENDTFDLALGLNRTLTHEPLKSHGFLASDEERGAIVGFYAVAVLQDGSRTFQTMGRRQVEKVRDESRGYQAARRFRKDSVWDTDFLSMGLKTVIRRLCKYLPRSPELAAALTLDAVAEQGQAQRITVEAALEGEYSAPLLTDDSPASPDDSPSAPDDPGTAKMLERIESALTLGELKVIGEDVATMQGTERDRVRTAWKTREAVLKEEKEK